MARDDEFPDEGGVDRRTFVKGAVGLGAVGLAGSLVASGASLFPPVVTPTGALNEGFVYAKGDTPNPFGFDVYAGQDARPEHFTKVWSGVAAIWRALFDEENKQIPQTGFPVLLIRVDPDLIQVPPAWTDRDYLADTGIIAIFDRCVHLCCFPQWHLSELPSAYQDYAPDRVPRTSLAGQDPIWCRCHNSQYDPVTLVWDVHPNGTLYISARMSHGPATRGLPMISIEEQAGRIVGTRFLDPPPKAPPSVAAALRGKDGSAFRDWYFAYCR